MSINLLEVQFSSQYASLKLVAEGGGLLSNPGTVSPGALTVSVNIPHNQGIDRLLWQVGGVISDPTSSISLAGIITPWTTSDGRIEARACLDSTNLTLFLTSSSAGIGGADAVDWTYFYRVLAP